MCAGCFRREDIIVKRHCLCCKKIIDRTIFQILRRSDGSTFLHLSALNTFISSKCVRFGISSAQRLCFLFIYRVYLLYSCGYRDSIEVQSYPCWNPPLAWPTTGSSEKPDFVDCPIKTFVDDIVNKKKHSYIIYSIVHHSGDS